MRLQLIYLLAVVSFVSATCPYSYVDGGNGYCYKVYSDNLSHFDASKRCVQDGGRLPYIPNGFTNELVRQTGASDSNVKYVWIGLTCLNPAVTSCKWDGTSSFLSNGSYTNFRPGFPYYGPYVFMYVSSGQWVTTTSDDGNNFVCEVPNSAPGLVCDKGYTQFQGNCYKAISAASKASAEATCQQECGDIASIHSADENQFITNTLSNSSSGAIYTRIGLYINPKQNFAWLDNSPFNYSNFGPGGNNANLGDCVTLALRNDAVNRGQWISSKCDNLYSSVCKKPLGTVCNPTTAAPMLAPPTCNQTMFFNNNGTIYSPGFPYPYISNRCIYIITVAKGKAKLTFPNFSLDANSYMDLFNDVGDSNPFVRLRYKDGLNRTYISTENEMKVIFYSPNGGSTDQNWQGIFSSY